MAAPARPSSRLRRSLAPLVAAVFFAGGGALWAGLAAPSAMSSTTAANAQVTGPFPGAVTGPLFLTANGRLGPHFCTASVVHSSHGNLLITAAHCLLGRSLQPAGAVVFAPGFRNGQAPAGLWDVDAVFVDSRWSANQNPNDDVAFLGVSRPGAAVEDVVGADYLGTSAQLPARVQVVGYPSASSAPVSCTDQATAFVTAALRQLKFGCGGFAEGTSGSPFRYQVGGSGHGVVIGVIGGYQDGGDSAEISYSVQFGPQVAALYQVADAWQPPA